MLSNEMATLQDRKEIFFPSRKLAPMLIVDGTGGRLTVV